MDYDKLMVRLGGQRQKLNLLAQHERHTDIQNEHRSDAHNLSEAIYCLKEYVDPWQCSKCKFLVKIPPDPTNKTKCPHCQTDTLMQYGYREHKRMDAQIKIMLAYVQRQSISGDLAAQQVMSRLAEAGA